MRIILPIVGAALLLASTAQAQRVSKVSGNELLKICSAASKANCDAYLSGVADAIATGGRAGAEACIPVGATGTELRDVVTKFLHDQPQMLHEKAGKVSISAFAKAYPCKA
jgi:hypothetical protein